MHDGSTFRLGAPDPAKDGYITLKATSPVTGVVDHCILQRPDGTLLAQFSINTVMLTLGDSLHVTLDAAQMVSFLTP